MQKSRRNNLKKHIYSVISDIIVTVAFLHQQSPRFLHMGNKLVPLHPCFHIATIIGKIIVIGGARVRWKNVKSASCHFAHFSWVLCTLCMTLGATLAHSHSYDDNDPHSVPNAKLVCKNWDHWWSQYLYRIGRLVTWYSSVIKKNLTKMTKMD